jgi:hypothetical protein
MNLFLNFEVYMSFNIFNQGCETLYLTNHNIYINHDEINLYMT